MCSSNLATLKVYTFNSVELRRIDVELLPTKKLRLNTVGGSAVATRSSGSNSSKGKAITKGVKQQRATPKSQTWVIPSSEENLILEACCN